MKRLTDREVLRSCSPSSMDAWAPPQTFAKRESLLKQSPVPVSRRVFCQLMFHPTRRNVTASDDRPRTIIVPYTPYTRYKHIYCIKTIEHVARYSITGARLVHDTSEISPYSSLSLAVSISISKFGKELQALRITIIATIGPIWTENYDILSFFVNEA